VYRVKTTRGTHQFLSRSAAIAAAHAAANCPLFEFRGDHITLVAQDGGLPDALATALRRRQLRSSGPIGKDYLYPASEADANWLAALMPGCMTGLKETPTTTGRNEVNSTARHSIWRFRPQWRAGILTL
jgi:hypothetical protein